MVINTLILRGPSAKANGTTKQEAADRDNLAINLIPPKHHAKRSSASTYPSTSWKSQADDTIWDNPTRRLDSRLRRPTRMLGQSRWLKAVERPIVLKGPMSPAWLNLTSTDIYVRKFLVLQLTLFKGIPTRKGFCKVSALMRIFPTRKDLLHQETNVNSTLL